MAPSPHKRRGCLLFYIYAFFFGLGTGIISLVSLGARDAPVITWVLSGLGVAISLCTGLSHFYLTCHGPGNKLGIYKRALLDISGLCMASVVTFSGVFTYIIKELFFLCGVFSASCYFMATIALSVNLYQVYNKKSTDMEGTDTGAYTREDSQTRRTIMENISMMSMSIPSAMILQACLDNPSGYYHTPHRTHRNYFSDIRPHRTETRELSIRPQRTETRELSIISGSRMETPHDVQGGISELHATYPNQVTYTGLPLGLSLPNYTDVTSSSPYSPPKYSDIVLPEGSQTHYLQRQSSEEMYEPPNEQVDTGCADNGGDCNNSEHLDQPPDYDAIICSSHL